jgi:thymidylate synthase ThyX
LDTHAQYEIREYAAAIFECAKLGVPITMDLFTEHRLYKIEISGDDLKNLAKFFDDHPELKVDGTPTGTLSNKIDSANKVLDSINNVVENVRKYRTLIEDNTSSNS